MIYYVRKWDDFKEAAITGSFFMYVSVLLYLHRHGTTVVKLFTMVSLLMYVCKDIGIEEA